jgi:threonine synthase
MTPGDTGSSAICAVKKSKWIDIVVLYPKGKSYDELPNLKVASVTFKNSKW